MPNEYCLTSNCQNAHFMISNQKIFAESIGSYPTSITTRTLWVMLYTFSFPGDTT